MPGSTKLTRIYIDSTICEGVGVHVQVESASVLADCVLHALGTACYQGAWDSVE